MDVVGENVAHVRGLGMLLPVKRLVEQAAVSDQRLLRRRPDLARIDSGGALLAADQQIVDERIDPPFAFIADSIGVEFRVEPRVRPPAFVGAGNDVMQKRIFDIGDVWIGGAVEVRAMSFPVLDHLELGEQHKLIDMEGGARIAGHGFYFLQNEAVLLELALQQFAVDFLIKEGFTPTITPDMARGDIVQGVGFVPRGPETQIYSVENHDLNLVATAEITLGGLYAGQVLDEEQLPIKLCGISHCYRTEAGAAGRAL